MFIESLGDFRKRADRINQNDTEKIAQIRLSIPRNRKKYA